MFLEVNMEVNIEFVELLIKRRNKINSVPLSEIDWYKNGVKVNIDKKIIEDFEIIGLNNIDFITTGFYRTGWNDKGEKHNTYEPPPVNRQ
jgi:hypothetical protein